MGRWLLLILVGMAIAGCVTDADRRVRANDRVAYRVRSGETLDSIAWRFNLDVNDVACWNRLRSAAQVRPGQLIFLSPPKKKDWWSRLYCRSSRHRATAASSRETTSATRRPPVVGPAEPTMVESSHRPQPRPIVITPPPRVHPLPAPMAVDWQWPLRDRDGSPPFVEQAPGKAGVLLRGRVGQPVFAAADGKVVYSGNNLKGYGELVIVKHNDELISAYGFNRRLFAPEGLWVKKGQKIAELGRQPDGRTVLYFDIRRFGKSVDPLRYLPRR